VTFSLVACDLEAEDWGVVVASRFLAAGAVVPWVSSDAGAVATQSYANVAFGPDGLELMRSGVSAQDALDRLVAGDPGRDQRQVGVVDRGGGAATYTGPGCHDWAGGRTGQGYAAQGNILTGAETVDAMAAAFESEPGALAPRMLTALLAGDRAGGDSRGRQSAALIVCRPGGGYDGGNDVLVDLRVDDHPDPAPELIRLFEMHDLLFGTTPEDELIPLEQVQAEVGERLAALGFTGALEQSLADWAGAANLELRLHTERIDPVLLRELRRAG
jgi:uncharacterized Ntn-hydrolase superfamily protein